MGATRRSSTASARASLEGNVEYQRSGKSVCTIYPEPASFTVLVVITEAIARVEALLHQFTEPVADVFRRSTLFNGTYWLMVPVADGAAAEDVKRLLDLKGIPSRGRAQAA